MLKTYWESTFICKIIFGFLLFNFAETQANELEKYLPAFAVAVNSDVLSSSNCRNDLNEFRIGVDEKVLWSLKVLDASGQPESRFFYGNNYWLGSKSQCLDLDNTKPLRLDPEFMKNISKYRNVAEEFPPFRLNYFIAYFYHNSTLQYQIRLQNEDMMTLGLCLPASCSADELGEILERIFESKTIAIGNLYSADYRLQYIQDGKDDYQWLFDWKFITTGTVLVLTIFMVIVGTSYDCIVHQKRLEMIKNSNNIADNSSVILPSKLQPNMFGRILLCYSLYTNAILTFDTKVSKGTVLSIFGIRFLGMLWTLGDHTLMYLIDYIDNRITLWRISSKLEGQLLSNGHFSVDTFFVLSGFLISWSFFNDKKKDHYKEKSISHFPWAKYFRLIIKRIIRIAPVYFIMIGITEIIFGWYKNTSFLIPNEDPFNRCTNYWWRNVLFINNLYPWNEICMTWSWYLSNDLQFHIIGTFLLLLSDIYFYISAFILIALIMISAIVSGLISYAHGYTATIDQMILQLDVLYTPPWMRIGPYLVGMITGYVLTKLNGKFNLSRKILCLFWTIGISCIICPLFGLYDRNLSLVDAGIYIGFSKIVWSVGITWILVACHTNNAGLINKILSQKFWIPFSNVTYCAYLLNPLITLSLAISLESPIHVDIFLAAIISVGITTVTLIIAFFATAIFELPYTSLYQVISESQKKKL